MRLFTSLDRKCSETQLGPNRIQIHMESLSRILFRRPLARELTLVLAAKIALIALAGIFLFGPAQRVHVDADIAAHKLLGSYPLPPAR